MLKLLDKSVVSFLFVCLMVGGFAVLLSGCDSSGSEMEEGREGPGEFDPQKTAETIESVEQAITSVREDTTIDPDNRNLYKELTSVANALAEVEGVETVRVPDDRLTATAFLESGVTFIISNNRHPGLEITEGERQKSGSGGQAATSASDRSSAQLERKHRSESAPQPEGSRAKADGEVHFPDSKKAIARAFAGGADQASQVQQYLSEADYEVNSSGTIGTNLLDMRDNYRNMGVLYLDTHGATFMEIDRVDGNPEPVGNRYALQTSTQPDLTEEWLRENEEDLLNQRIVLGKWCVLGQSCAEDIDTVDVSGKNARVAVTDKFVDEYWSFSSNGFAYIHACWIGGPLERMNEGAEAMRQAILNSGARAMVGTKGFTNTGALEESIYATFEMMLPTARREYGRPWSLQKTHGGLEEKGLTEIDWYSGQVFAGLPVDPTEDQSRKTKVKMYGNKATGLAPSIRRLEAIDDASKSQGRLRVKGHFPDTKGTLTIGGTELTVQEWTREQVVAEVPFSGESATGLVRAKHEKGIRGNAVTLTEWTGSMETVVKGQGSQQARSTLDMSFRGDIHPTRESPTADPTLPENIEPYISPASEGQIKGSGSHVDEDGDEVVWTGENSYQIVEKSLVDQWYGNGPTEGSGSSLTAGQLSPNAQTQTQVSYGPDYGPANGFGGRMALRPKAGSGEMCLRIYGQWTVVASGSVEFALPQFLLSAANVSGGTPTDGTPPLGCSDVAFRNLPSDPTLTGGEFYFNPDGESSNVESIEVDWSSLEADPRPRPWTQQ